MFGNHVHKKISAYLHGELPPQEARLVAEHLHTCERCALEYEEIKFGANLAAQLLKERAPESLWDDLKLWDKMPNRHHQPEKELPGFFGRPLAVGLACAAIAIFAALTFVFYKPQPAPDQPDNRPFWEVTRLNGKPEIGAQKIDEKGRLPLGEWLVTDDSSRAQISVGQIGEVKIEPNSRVQLLATVADNHRLSLQQGKMEAFIWAPPRQFFVETPSALAVDLGCSYTLEINDDGAGLLHVTMGWVAFELNGRESFVPADAMCVTRPGFGPGTPYFSDASPVLQSALAKFDTAGADQTVISSALDAVLAEARKRDALTLWHLLARTEGGNRGRVYDRLAKLVPPPSKVSRSGVLAGKRAMLDAWWDKLELGDTEWWRMWKGPLPTHTK